MGTGQHNDSWKRNWERGQGILTYGVGWPKKKKKKKKKKRCPDCQASRASSAPVQACCAAPSNPPVQEKKKKKKKKKNLERGFPQLPLEGCQGGSLCRCCWQGIPGWDGSRKERKFKIISTAMKMSKL